MASPTKPGAGSEVSPQKKKKNERQRSTLLFYSFIEKNGEPSHKRHLRNIILLEWPENMTQTRKLAGFFLQAFDFLGGLTILDY